MLIVTRLFSQMSSSKNTRYLQILHALELMIYLSNILEHSILSIFFLVLSAVAVFDVSL